MSDAPRKPTGRLHTTKSGIVFVEREGHALIPILDADGKRWSDLWVGLGAYFNSLHSDLGEAVVTVGDHTAAFEALDCGIERMLVCRATRASGRAFTDGDVDALGKVWSDIADGYQILMRERRTAGDRPALTPVRCYRWDEFERRIYAFHDLMDGFGIDWIGNPAMTRLLREFDVVGTLGWHPAAVVSQRHMWLNLNVVDENAARSRAREWVANNLPRPSHLVPGDYWLFADERDAVHFMLYHT